MIYLIKRMINCALTRKSLARTRKKHDFENIKLFTITVAGDSEIK